ncbi:MAG: putative S-layer protein [Candidatus Pacearchaeota archaeon]|nr:putative S-layer protein [Candidatus Pacearchaeota archaeon]
MANKTIKLLVLSILALVTLATFASAAVTYVTVTGNNQSVIVGKTATISFKLKESNYGNLTNMSFNVPITLNDSSSTYSFTSQSTVTGMVTTLNQNILSGLMSLAFSVPATQQPGTYTGKLTLKGTYVTEMTYDLPITINVLSESEPKDITECKTTGNQGSNLNLDIDKIKVTKGFGDKTTWSPLDEIQVDVNVANDGDEKMRGITVGWGLYDKDTDKFVIDGEENDFNLDSGKDKTLTITFKLDDPSEFKDSGDYVFYVWANAEDKEFEDVNNGDTCAVVSDDTVELNIESSFVMLDSLEVVGTVSCGDTVQLTGKAWNFGEDDEDGVYVVIQNSELGINSKVQLGTVDAFDSKDLLFDIKIPSNAEEKTYELQLSVLNEDGEVFQNENDDYSKFVVSVKPEGGCTNEPEASVLATLESEKVEAGKEFVVKATIRNDASTSKTFDLSVEGYTDWASLVSLDKDTLSIDAGKSADVLVKFKVNAGVSGSQNFNFVLTENEQVLTQPVSVSVEKSNVFGGFTGAFLGGDNWYIWGIGALNVILIIVIIIVAVRVMRK